MKRLLVFVFIGLILNSCSVYHVAILDYNGEIIKEHETKKMYTGTNSFVLDAVTAPFAIVCGLFVPTPSLTSSIGVTGGMQLTSYINQIPLHAGSGNWITFDGNDGREYSYNGFNYVIDKKQNFKANEKVNNKIKKE